MSPGVYLKDDPILGSHLQNRCELRAPLVEKAAFYLDAALSERSTIEDSHFLYTLHIYQYNLAQKGSGKFVVIFYSHYYRCTHLLTIYLSCTHDFSDSCRRSK